MTNSVDEWTIAKGKRGTHVLSHHADGHHGVGMGFADAEGNYKWYCSSCQKTAPEDITLAAQLMQCRIFAKIDWTEQELKMRGKNAR